jgi:hypothetical protein
MRIPCRWAMSYMAASRGLLELTGEEFGREPLPGLGVSVGQFGHGAPAVGWQARRDVFAVTGEGGAGAEHAQDGAPGVVEPQGWVTAQRFEDAAEFRGGYRPGAHWRQGGGSGGGCQTNVPLLGRDGVLSAAQPVADVGDGRWGNAGTPGDVAQRRVRIGLEQLAGEFPAADGVDGASSAVASDTGAARGAFAQEVAPDVGRLLWRCRSARSSSL